MKGNLSIGLIAALIFVGGAKMVGSEGGVFSPTVVWAMDPLNAAYIIEGEEVRLVQGRAKAEFAPGSATKIKTSVFGKPEYGDLDGDGDEDAALFLVQDPGGSGTFYYVAASLNKGAKYSGTNAVLVGDRIAPQTLKIRDGVIIADYNDRRPDEPMAAPPSVGKKKLLAIKDGRLEEMKK